MKDDGLYLAHMTECISNIEEDTVDGKETFITNRTIRDAVMRNLQLLGESAKRVSPTTTGTFPEVPWRKLAGFRDVVVHDYLRIDYDDVWAIIENDIPPLKAQLQHILQVKSAG